LAIGINDSLKFVDLNSNTIINTVNGAHYNGVLSCEFDPFKSFILATSGMDYSIKFWDIRRLDSPLNSIFNNSHWIWDIKYNKKFSRVMINSSSSSNVKAIVFGKEEDDNFKFNDLFKQTNLKDYSLIDYNHFDDSVYSVDWSLNDPWIFAAVSYNSGFHINSIPDDIKYQVMLDN
jgi:WD40 repeat protein